jgi:hypothetical protein
VQIVQTVQKGGTAQEKAVHAIGVNSSKHSEENLRRVSDSNLQPRGWNCSHHGPGRTGHHRTGGIGLVLSKPIAAAFLSLALLVFCGCVGMKPQRGGSVTLHPHGGSVLQQGENAQQPTTQITDEEIEREWGSVPDRPVATLHSDAPEFQASDSPRKESIKRRTETKLGAAQKDTAREMAAKFANMRPVQWIGILCILGAGAFIYFQWWTPAMIAGGTGLGLILLAHSIVGNERLVLILLLAALAIVVTFRAYEKGKLDHILPDLLDKGANRATRDASPLAGEDARATKQSP